MTQAVIGVDVGSGSARAGVFDLGGRALASRTHPIQQFRPEPGHVEQSSADIWEAVCICVRGAVQDAQTRAGTLDVRGIGFDATCSLVAVDARGAPVSLSTTGRPDHDIIMWMDQRAVDQAARINATGADVLRYVGGRISPEMQTPKLLWLAENLPDAFERAHAFYDLPDYLTFRATGASSRSLCSLVCKWTYLGHEQRWDADYFRRIGLGVLADETFDRIGTEVLPLGAAVGQGLGADAAAAFGLPAGIAVSASAIDAHAGGIGLIGAEVPGDAGGLRTRIALIMGTSSCHMAVSDEPAFVPGVWGPYWSAMLPGQWLNEGGQSAVGSLIDHLVQTHAGLGELRADGPDVFAALNQRVERLAAGLDVPASLSAGLHVGPDFLGNRSPRADASLRGMISGLPMSASGDDLARLYLAACQGLAYGTRHIIEAMNATGGYAIETILACGGWTKNELFLREHADATGCRIVLPEEPEAVLLGAAVLGAVAGGVHADIGAAMAAMTRAGRVIEPKGGATKRYHDAKYAVFHRMHADQIAYRELMLDAN